MLQTIHIYDGLFCIELNSLTKLSNVRTCNCKPFPDYPRTYAKFTIHYKMQVNFWGIMLLRDACVYFQYVYIFG